MSLTELRFTRYVCIMCGKPKEVPGSPCDCPPLTEEQFEDLREAIQCELNRAMWQLYGMSETGRVMGEPYIYFDRECNEYTIHYISKDNGDLGGVGPVFPGGARQAAEELLKDLHDFRRSIIKGATQ